MKMHELKSILENHPEKLPRFTLPDGDQVPSHFHLTEVGYVSKNFIDCGGTIRKIEGCSLQLWVSDADKAHRLNAGKFAKILSLGYRVLPHDDLSVEVEYDDYAISQFPIASAVVTERSIDFALTTKRTACLAKEKCGVDSGCSDRTNGVTACC